MRLTHKLTIKRSLLSILMAATVGACGQPPIDSDPESKTVEVPGPPFDATALWTDIRNDFDLFYAYRDRRGFDANAYLDRVGTLVSAAPNKTEFRRRLNRAMYAFTDPHLGFGPREDNDFNTIPTSSDLQIDHRDGDYYVVDVRADSAAYQAGIRPGWQFVSVVDKPTEYLAPLVFSELVDNPDDAQLDYAGTLLANGRRTGERQLSFIKPNSETQVFTIANARELAQAVNNRPLVDTRWITSDQGHKIAVLRINNRLGDNNLIPAFDSAISDVSGADSLILDLRNTPSGGNSEVGRSILGHFTDKLRPFQTHTVPSLEREFGVPRRFTESVAPRSPHFDPSRTVVLGGYWTGSMGEGIVIGMDALGVHTIASDMGDLLGGMSNFSFSDSTITLSIPTEALFHIDGTPREDFVADKALTAADSDEDGGDPALIAALDHLQLP